MSTVDEFHGVRVWIRRVATIGDLREVMDLARAELERPFVCAECGHDIATALPRKHPDHARTCSGYTSMVTY